MAIDQHMRKADSRSGRFVFIVTGHGADLTPKADTSTCLIAS
ncbi:hypothetical protein [Hoeflea ulvae]|uniref:Uncharacterized protein n=1 Tax=Hoeflea ulvae TaxID=2983764 RepID=A0ABT3YJF3_9HYPH|nr:hypothetical protein [Hoeflea ulvae]MCY0096034.1 hypothetical protein [Hoeflea ulvae]